MAKRKQAHAGGHGWFVTFADLMGLLVSFFVMLVAFSNQDQKKLQIVAGSMRDAFGVQTNVRYSGVIEVDGLPTRPKLKNAAHIDPEDASATPTTDEQDHKREHGAHLKNDQAFALAAASLRQALQDMPELAEASKHIMVEETKEGLNIDLVDQEGRSMFPEGSKEPYERTRRIIEKLAGPLKATPYRLSITGHTLGIESAAQGVLGICRQTAPMRSGKSSRRKVFRRAASTRLPAGQIPIRSFPRIPTLPPIAG
jgi:chemotaxis protein MotB